MSVYHNNPLFWILQPSDDWLWPQLRFTCHQSSLNRHRGSKVSRTVQWPFPPPSTGYPVIYDCGAVCFCKVTRRQSWEWLPPPICRLYELHILMDTWVGLGHFLFFDSPTPRADANRGATLVFSFHKPQFRLCKEHHIWVTFKCPPILTPPHSRQTKSRSRRAARSEHIMSDSVQREIC